MRRWTYVLCGALFLGPVVSMAAPELQPYPQCAGKPTDNDQKAAKSLFTAGQVAFNEADYKSAIQYWRDAYKRDCTANLLLLNLSRAYESAGDKREAVAALKLYLEREPKAADRPQIERRIENLMSQISGPQPTATNVPAPTASVAATSGTAQPAGTVAPVPTGTSEPTPAGPKKPITPWIVVGAGGVVTVLGALVYMGGKSKVSDAESICPDRSKCNDPDAAKKGNDGRSQENLGGVMMGVGLAGVAGGLVWQFVFNKPKPNPTAGITNVGPSVGSGFTGLSLQGQF